MTVLRSRSRDGTKDPIRRPTTIMTNNSNDNHSNSNNSHNDHSDDYDDYEEDLLLGYSHSSLGMAESGESLSSPRVRHSPSSVTSRASVKLPTSLFGTATTNTTTNNNNTLTAMEYTTQLPNLMKNPTKKINNSSSSSLVHNKLQQVMVMVRHNPDAIPLATALVAWFLPGVLAICTTKLLCSTSIQDGGVPSPLVLTFQQMFLGSNILRLLLWCKGTLKPWPKEISNNDKNNNTTSQQLPFVWWKPTTYIANNMDYLLLTGLFNGLDFLASNTSFSHSSATFVETIKASEPITTAALAIWWGIDRLGKMETLSLTILITGVLMSTYANAMAAHPVITTAGAAAAEGGDTTAVADSIKTCLTVMTANLCFAFRAMSQKLLRQSPQGSSQNLDDFNLLFRMQQTGAASLLGPVLLFQNNTLFQVFFGRPSWSVFGYYIGLSLVNAWAFATYSLASCYILSRISVLQHAGCGCLRRMFAIVATSVAFGIPISAMGAMGIVMCVIGFSGFTHFRFQRQGQSKKSAKDEGNDNGSVDDLDKGRNRGFGVSQGRSSSGVETAPLSSASSEPGTHPV